MVTLRGFEMQRHNCPQALSTLSGYSFVMSHAQTYGSPPLVAPTAAEDPDTLALSRSLKAPGELEASCRPAPISHIKRTLMLLDATGSGHNNLWISACRRKIEEVFARVHEILSDQAVDACFELQFVLFRNYDQDPPNLLSCSNWEKTPLNLESFLSHARAFGGDFAASLCA